MLWHYIRAGWRKTRQEIGAGNGDLDLGDNRVDGEEWTNLRDVMSRGLGEEETL